MGPVFADTFYWVALTNVKDAAHEQAKTFSRSSSLSSIVTTELVLIEYLNFFAAWGSSHGAGEHARLALKFDSARCALHRRSLSGRPCALR